MVNVVVSLKASVDPILEIPGRMRRASQAAKADLGPADSRLPDEDESLHDILRLRRDTAMPLYKQLEEQLTRLIESGRIAPGTTLPAERQLAEVLGISRATVQQSYGSLRERQLIAGHGRHGSIVQGSDAKLLPGMDRLRGFTQEMLEFGRAPSTRVLEHEIVTDRSIASIFGLHSTARFVRLVRIRLGDDVPLSRESAWYSLDAAPIMAEIDPAGSVYGQLAERGQPLAYCDQTIEATSPTEIEREVFGFDHEIPCLLIKRQSYFRSGQMVEYVEGVFRGDVYSYRIRLDT